MVDESSTENPRASAGGQSSNDPAGIDSKELKELVKLASQERKNLQLLVEYFDKKFGEIDERKKFFDRMSSQVPDTLRELDSLNERFEEIKTFDVRIRDFQRISKELSSLTGKPENYVMTTFDKDVSMTFAGVFSTVLTQCLCYQ